MAKVNFKQKKYELIDMTKTAGDNDELYLDTKIGYIYDEKKLIAGLGVDTLKLPNGTGADAVLEEIYYDADDHPTNAYTVLNYFSVANTKGLAGLCDHRLELYGDDGMIYEIRMHTGSRFILSYSLWDFSFSTKPTCIGFMDDELEWMMYSAGSDELYVWAPTTYIPNQLEMDHNITSLCVCDNYLYGTCDSDKVRVYYTDTLKVENLQESAANSKSFRLLDDRGDCLKVISFKDYVFVIREYGITKAYMTSSGNISITQLYRSPSKIFENTVSVCGDNIIFLTRKGLVEFNGISCDVIETDIDKYLIDVNNQNAFASSVGNKYYLVCNIRFDDGEVVGVESDVFDNNAIVCLNIDDYSTTILRGIDVSGMVAITDDNTEKICITLNGENKKVISELSFDGEYLGSGTYKKMFTNELLLSEKIENIITRLEVVCNKNTTIDLITDRGNLHFLASNDGYNCFAMNARARSVKVVLKTDEAAAFVSKISLTTLNVEE